MTYEDLTESQKRALFDAAAALKADGPSHPTPLTQAVIDALSPQVIATDDELAFIWDTYLGYHTYIPSLRAIAADTWKRAAKEAAKVSMGLAADMREYAAQALRGRP